MSQGILGRLWKPRRRSRQEAEVPSSGALATAELAPPSGLAWLRRAPRPARHVGRAEKPASVRQLTLLFKRNPHCDAQNDRIRYEGYHICWPDGRPVSIGLERFCQQGSRLLGLGRKMAGKEQQLVEVSFHPVSGLEAPLTRLGPGIRTRRFYLLRRADNGKIFFFNDSPTEVEFDAHNDDPRILWWLGLRELSDHEQSWFDLSARSLI